MVYLQSFERKLDEPTKNLQSCLEYLRVLQLLASSPAEPSASSLIVLLESTLDTLNITFAELEEIRKTLSPNS